MNMGGMEIIEYEHDAPFHIRNITWESQQDALGNMLDVLEHWHEELEIVYTVVGHAVHYIDGHPYTAHPGSVFVVNPESIHKVISDSSSYERSETVAIVLHINSAFLKQLIPGIHDLYFLPEGKGDNKKLGSLMREISRYADTRSRRAGDGRKDFEYLHIVSMIYEIFYQLGKDRPVLRDKALPVNSAKNVERLRGIMQYVEKHYQEKLMQAQVAEKFYFTKEYFARFFSKNTGLTFMEYLTKYRLAAARSELLETDRTVLDIALDNGFSDARGFINAFKRQYGTTPLQYRKSAI